METFEPQPLTLDYFDFAGTSAGALKTGDYFRDGDGTWMRVLGVRTRTPSVQNGAIDTLVEIVAERRAPDAVAHGI
jgi:hypothetical protein